MLANACGADNGEVLQGSVISGTDLIAGNDAAPREPDTSGPDTRARRREDAFGAEAGAVAELCANYEDDDGDGRIDEGCWPGPNLRGDQRWRDFGVWRVSDGVFFGPEVQVPVWAGWRAVVLARDLAGSPRWVIADSVQDPVGEAWLGAGPWPRAPARGAPAFGHGSSLIGGSDAIPVAAGTWKIGFLRTAKVMPTGPGPAEGGWLQIGALYARPATAELRIDLDIYAVGAQPMAVAELGGSAFMKQVIARIDAAWKPAGLAVGKVVYIDVQGADGEKYRYVDNVAATDGTNELPGLFALAASRRPESTALSIFFVADLQQDGQPVAAGITGQLAGLAGLAGHPAAGIALAVPADDVAKSLQADPTAETAGALWGRVLAHELGHYLGLWHTSEQGAGLQDTIMDTPECELPAGKAILLPSDCTATASNLMFWSPQGLELTAGQVEVARRHPTPRGL